MWCQLTSLAGCTELLAWLVFSTFLFRFHSLDEYGLVSYLFSIARMLQAIQIYYVIVMRSRSERNRYDKSQSHNHFAQKPIHTHTHHIASHHIIFLDISLAFTLVLLTHDHITIPPHIIPSDRKEEEKNMQRDQTSHSNTDTSNTNTQLKEKLHRGVR
jgi:uncharacterized membrane protein YcgQ (UPF0703/DUF1980 family)